MISEKQAQYLDAMGIEVWQSRSTENHPPPQQAAQSSWQLPRGAMAAWLLQQTVRTVNAGSSTAGLLIIGDWCTEHYSQHAGFSGEAGNLLDGMLKAIGLSRSDTALLELTGTTGEDSISVASVISENPFKVVLFMSALPMDYHLDNFECHGIPEQTCLGVPLIVSIHPAYLLANSAVKRTAWEDLKQVRSLLESD